MGSENRNKIKKAIAELGKADAYEIHLGTVKTVNEANASMTVDVDDLTFYDVRLRSIISNDTGFWVKPKVNSKVIIAQIEGGVDCFLVRAEEIDKFFIKIGTQTFEMTSTGFIFNGGTNDGIVLIADLITKLNNIENKVNTIIAAHNAHTHITTATVGASATPGVNAVTAAPIAGTLSPTVQTELEHPKIKV